MLPARHVKPADCIFSICCTYKTHSVKKKLYLPTDLHYLHDAHDTVASINVTDKIERVHHFSLHDSTVQLCYLGLLAIDGCGNIRIWTGKVNSFLSTWKPQHSENELELKFGIISHSFETWHSKANSPFYFNQRCCEDPSHRKENYSCCQSVPLMVLSESRHVQSILNVLTNSFLLHMGFTEVW